MAKSTVALPRKGDTIAIRVEVTRVHTDARGISWVTMRIPGAEAPVTVNADHLEVSD